MPVSKSLYCEAGILLVFAFVAISSRSSADVAAKTEADKIVPQALAADRDGDQQQRERLVPNKGWQMAKFIKPGEPLMSAKGILQLNTSDNGTEVDVFNLSVGEFHTYFVGRNRVLDHDSTCPEPTINVFPGVSPNTTTSEQLVSRN
jgi:hypothetical protein